MIGQILSMALLVAIIWCVLASIAFFINPIVMFVFMLVVLQVL